jgi:hypothetical protein
MYLGTMPDHAKDTYCFLNIATNQIIHSRNVVWLNKSYGDFMKLGPDQVSFIQAKLLACATPSPGVPPRVSSPPVVLPPSEPPAPPVDPGSIIRPPVVLPIGAPSPVVTIMGPPAFLPGAVRALSVAELSYPQFTPPNLFSPVWISWFFSSFMNLSPMLAQCPLQLRNLGGMFP